MIEFNDDQIEALHNQWYCGNLHDDQKREMAMRLLFEILRRLQQPYGADQFPNQMDALYNPEIAIGQRLDGIGSVLGIERSEQETDVAFRRRIQQHPRFKKWQGHGLRACECGLPYQSAQQFSEFLERDKNDFGVAYSVRCIYGQFHTLDPNTVQIHTHNRSQPDGRPTPADE